MRKTTCRNGDGGERTIQTAMDRRTLTASDRVAWAMLPLLFLAALTGCERSPSQIAEKQDNPPATTAVAPQPRAEATAPRPVQSAPIESPVARATAPESTATPDDSSELTFAPRDECSGQVGLPEFRAQIAASMHARDAARFTALAAPDVQLDYGGGSGRTELTRRLNDPHRGLWDELDQILQLGCGVEGDLVVLPWVFWNVPDDIDAYRAMIVLGEAVPLLAQPDPAARVQAKLNWALVTVSDGFKPTARFSAVTTRGGQKGFIETARLRSLLDYRLIAERRNDQWQITAFIAGD